MKLLFLCFLAWLTSAQTRTLMMRYHMKLLIHMVVVLVCTTIASAQTRTLNINQATGVVVNTNNPITFSTRIALRETSANQALVINTNQFVVTNGNIGIGLSSPLAKWHTYRDTPNATFSGLVEEDGAGDASISFLLTGLSQWSMGIDNSDGQRFKLSASSTLGTTDELSVDLSGVTAFTNLYVVGSNLVSMIIATNASRFLSSLTSSNGTFTNGLTVTNGILVDEPSSGGTPATLDKILLGNTTTDVGSIGIGAQGTVTITVTGAGTNDFPVLNLPTSIGSLHLSKWASVTATNTVTVYMDNYNAVGSIDPPNAKYSVMVFRAH